MTAEEIAKSVRRLKSWEEDDEVLYVFSTAQFQAFVNQLCKEQRHECQIERNKRSVCIDGVWYVACEDVMNSKQPEIYL